MNKCLYCQEETKNAKFCSRSCAASLNNKLVPKRVLTRKCTQCNSVVRDYRSLLCEQHYSEYKDKYSYQNKTIGEYRNMSSVSGKHPSWIHAHVRLFARNWNKDLRKIPCAKCGYKKHVELCHIKDISSFHDDALLSEVNSINNIIQLCPNCHWEFDNGYRNNFIELLHSLNKKF